jgi:hypothetical protein
MKSQLKTRNVKTYSKVTAEMLYCELNYNISCRSTIKATNSFITNILNRCELKIFQI